VIAAASSPDSETVASGTKHAPVGEVVSEPRRDSDRQPRLAHTAWAKQRHKMAVLFTHDPRNLVDIGCSSEQRGGCGPPARIVAKPRLK
jgi:hypothetical protein